MTTTHQCFLALVIGCILIFSGCAHQPQIPSIFHSHAGFWSGLLHGLIAPISFIASLFTDCRIYEYPNSGRWYDFGFMIGIGGFSGGMFGIFRGKKK